MKTISLLLFVLTLLTLPAYAATKNAAPQINAIEHSKVCMVQNRAEPMKMIPVEVEGKTYYGCCKNCVARLLSTPEVRFAKDPVTGKEVDKAKAFIVVNQDNTVTYFETEKTAKQFFSRKSL